mgnify:CR=1 FL=1
MPDLLKILADIVGAEFVSDAPEEKFIYAMDPGTMPPCEPDIVVMPGSTDEVQKIVHVANAHRVPLVPLGAGLVLSGLSRALKGGIILGRARWIEAVRKNPLARIVRVDKLTLAALEATLGLFLDEETALAEVPTLRMLQQSVADLDTGLAATVDWMRSYVEAG